MRTQSLRVAKYFLTFIDDFSRNIWVYFLKNKYEVLTIFKQLKAMVENESGQRIKVLKSDTGGGYESHAFCNFCYYNGIQRKTFVAKTSQQNSVAEWNKRSIMEMVQCMLKICHLIDQFGVEVDNSIFWLNTRGLH